MKCAAAVGALIAAMPFQAFAAGASDGDMFAGLPTVSDAELAQNRGGFSIGKVVVSFGFSIKTSVRGPNIAPVTITTNFTVSTPGHLQNLGTEISGAVRNDLQKAGLIGGGDAGTPMLADTINQTVADAVSGGTNQNAGNTNALKVAETTPNVGSPVVPQASNVAPSLVASAPPSPPVNVVSNPPALDIPASPPGPSTANPSNTQLMASLPNTAGVSNLPSLDDVVPLDLSVPSVPVPQTPMPKGEVPVAVNDSLMAIAPSANDAPPSNKHIAPLANNVPPSKDHKDTPVSDSILPSEAVVKVAKPQQEFVATFDDKEGSIALSNGAGTDVLVKTLTGHLALVQNSNNDLTIQHEYAASYVIENYRDIARAAQLVDQLSGVTHQLVVMHGLAGR